MAATAMLSLPASRPAAQRPALPTDLPQLRPLGFGQKAHKFASSVDRVRASTSAVQFVRPDCPPEEEQPAKQAAAKQPFSQPRLHGRSALEQAAFITNGKLQDVRSSKALRMPAFKLGLFGL